MIEKLAATLCFFPIFFWDLHGFSHIYLFHPLVDAKHLGSRVQLWFPKTA